MTNSEPVAPLGSQPRIWSAPPSIGSAGAEAVDLAAQAGLDLDPWQQFVLQHSLGEREDHKWAAFEVGLVVSRQNGKGSILEARELAGLFLLGERFIIHSAHLFDTSLEAFRRLLTLVEENAEFSRRVKRVVKSHGEEGIELIGGQRIRFRSRTKGGGRGFSADCLILDEAMILPVASHGAMLPTLSARPNPQAWYVGSVVDQRVHADGIVLSRIRERGLAGGDPSLAYFEWSIDIEGPLGKRPTPDDVDPDTAADPASWAVANPGLGIRISEEHVEHERLSMDPRTFAVERLGVGDWPILIDAGSVITIDAWNKLIDGQSEWQSSPCLCYDVAPDRSSAAIGVAGERADGNHHLEVLEHRSGTGWVAPRLAELVEEISPNSVVYDGIGAANSLVPAIEELGVELTPVKTSEHGQAFGMVCDAVEDRTIRHLGQPELSAAIRGAAKRPLGDSAFAWSRKTSSVDISPLVAVTLAHWASVTVPAYKEPWIAWR